MKYTENSNEPHQNSIERGFEKVITPFQTFIKDQTTSSALLIVCAILALLIANSPLAQPYQDFLHLPVGFVVADYTFSMSVRHWINDGLMSFFFFLLGMEIKRELLVGEIRKLDRLVPIMSAALGGMLLPALIYFSFNSTGDFAHGWAIPMATDTAFAVGVLALLAGRVPVAAFSFLTALAIIDDLGAILVIALFYTENLNTHGLLLSLGLFSMLIVFNYLGIKNVTVYLFFGVILWVFMLHSGLHATVAGVLVAASVPSKPKRSPQWFATHLEKLFKRFRKLEQGRSNNSPILAEAEQHAVVENIQLAAEKSTTPLRRWENILEHPVSLFVLPVFALANAGVAINLQQLTEFWFEPMALGIVLGLVLGKALGISLFTWLVVRFHLGKLPDSLNMKHIVGLGLLAGMGFTMSIFISTLGFSDMPQILDLAKTAILIASAIAGTLGFIYLRYV